MKRQEFASPAVAETEISSPRILERLEQAGAIVRLDKLDHIYHGRVADETESWSVDPFFESDNLHNVYSKTFYATPNIEDAKDFARARTAESGKRLAHVVELTTTRPNQSVIAKNAPSEIGREMFIGFTTGAPATSDLEARAAKNIRENYESWLPKGRYMFTMEEIEKFADGTLPGAADREEWRKAMDRYGRVYNSARLIVSGQLSSAADVVLGSAELKVVLGKDGSGQDTFIRIPFSKEYISEVFRRAGIVGVQTNLKSATLGRSVEDTFIIWDSSALQRRKVVESTKKLVEELTQPLNKSLDEFMHPVVADNNFAKLRNIASDPYSSPFNIVQEARKIPGITELLDRSAGVWEGYSVGEHTETALHIFERYFADDVPAEFVGFIKTSLLLHDIGKGVAVANGHQGNQEKYNLKYAGAVLDYMGYSQKAKELVLDIIGPGARYFSNMYRYGKDQAELERYVQDLSRRTRSDGSTASAPLFENLQRLFYMCDAGAYTRMGRYNKVIKGSGSRTVVNALPSLDHLFDISIAGTRIKQK